MCILQLCECSDNSKGFVGHSKNLAKYIVCNKLRLLEKCQSHFFFHALVLTSLCNKDACTE